MSNKRNNNSTRKHNSSRNPFTQKRLKLNLVQRSIRQQGFSYVMGKWPFGHLS